jgi:hypothetical protein
LQPSTDQEIGAIWIDSAYADIKSVLEQNWVTESGLPQLVLYSAEGTTCLLYGYDLAASRPVDQVGKLAARPIFMAHCQEDNIIPISNMDQSLSVTQNTQFSLSKGCTKMLLASLPNTGKMRLFSAN